MSAFGITLIALGAFYLGFFTAALMAAAGRGDKMNGQPNYLDQHNLDQRNESVFNRIDIPPGFDSDRVTLYCRTPGEEDVEIEAEKEGLAVLRDEDGEIVGFWAKPAVKESLTTAPEWKPPFNWCGEQGVPFDEYGVASQCCICGAEMPEGNQVCVDCKAKARGSK